MAGVFNSIVYIIISFFIVIFEYAQFSTAIKNTKLYNSSYKRKMPIYLIVAFSLAYTLFNVYITGNRTSFTGDRYNYYIDFWGRKSTIGLNCFFGLIHLFTDDFKIALYMTTFVSCFCTFFAFRLSKDASPKVFVFLILSNFIFNTFYALKQSLACAFASLFFVFAMQEKSKKKDLICILLAIIAYCFHPTGFVLFPIYIITNLNLENTKKTKLIIILLMLSLVFFRKLMMSTALIVQPVFPSLSLKINQYFNETTSANEDGSIIAAFKGFPYYLIFTVGLLKRKKLNFKIKNYDNYLIISAFSTLLYLCTVVSYWFSRFVGIFLFPLGIFICRILEYEEDRKKQIIITFLVFGSLAYFTFRSFVLLYINYGGY